MQIEKENMAALRKQDRYQEFLSCLIDNKTISENDSAMVLSLCENSNDSLPVLLNRLGLVEEERLSDFLSDYSGHPKYKQKELEIADLSSSLSKIPNRFWCEYKVVPITETKETLTISVVDPIDDFIPKALFLATDKNIKLQIATISKMDAALEFFNDDARTKIDQLADNIDSSMDVENEDYLKDLASEAPVIRMVNMLIERAVNIGASDIHFEPFENRLVVRNRIDGVLQEVESPPARLTAAIVSRLKLMAGLDVAEKRLPQDGRVKTRVQGKEIDLRVSTIPTMNGESVVLRILSKENLVESFEDLGFSDKNLERLNNAVAKPQGILLVTGPTGSGKTTTLYAALSRLNEPGRKIITVEDPIEYQLEGVNQIQVKQQIGMDFAVALRSIVRQDPDVIMIGEMRDLETIKIAINSALTGHTVLSTLHTNDASSGITRLMEMGVEPFLLTSTINAVVAQRLVRTLCPECRQLVANPEEIFTGLRMEHLLDNSQGVTLYEPCGCNACGNTGYQGRIGIVEILEVDENVRGAIIEAKDAVDIKAKAIAAGMRSMYEDGLIKAIKGITSVAEVIRVIGED